jgi:hypothetical protein
MKTFKTFAEQIESSLVETIQNLLSEDVPHVGGYEREALHNKQHHYNSAGDSRKVDWKAKKGRHNFTYRKDSGEMAHGHAPDEWIKEVKKR